ncbi:MAG: ABC transporter ATP-binding protein [Nonlabens sp.]
MIAIIKDLSVCFKGPVLNKVLHQISFEIKPNEILAIVGESGSGKSVTSKVLMGLLPAKKTFVEASTLDVLGESVLNYKWQDWKTLRGNKVSMVFQEPMSSLNPTLSCGAQVVEILQQHLSLPAQDARYQVLDLFEKVKLPNPESTFHKYPHELSGGQMQRVMIAMAIACKPQLLIADEPTTALDVTVQKDIIDLLKSLQEEYGMSILFISHDLTLVKSIADRIIVMRQGKIVEQGSNSQIFDSPQQDYTRALLASRPPITERPKRLATVGDYLNKEDDALELELISTEQRRNAHNKMYAQPPILKAANLVVQYRLKKELFKPQQYYTAVDNLSLDVYPTESLGLVGESGCGKSTLGNALIGLRTIISGKIVFNNVDLTELRGSELRKLRKDIQIIFQDPFSSLNPRLTVGQAIQEPMRVHGIGSNHKDRKLRVINLLEKVGLSADQYDRYPHEFSGGQRQRIGIARTVALQPKFIVCDESVSALDLSVQAQVLNLLNDLKQEFGFSYLFISHDLSVVKYFCDRVMVMNKGKIVEIQEADQLYKLPTSDYTKMLIAAIPN